MKHLLFCAALLCGMQTAMAQGPLTYSGVVLADSLDQEALFLSSQVWFGKHFKNAQEVLQVQDQAAGVIVGTGSAPFWPRNQRETYQHFAGRILFVLKLEFKDGRFKYTFSDFFHEGHWVNLGAIPDQEDSPWELGGTSKGMRQSLWRNLRDDVDQLVNEIVASLEAEVPVAASDDW